MNDLTVALTLTADGKQLIGTIKNSQTVVSNLNATLTQTQGASRSAAQGLAQIERQSGATASAMDLMGKSLVAAVASLSVGNLAQQVSQDLAAYQDVRTRLQSLSGSAAAYAQNQQFLIELTKRHSKELILLETYLNAHPHKSGHRCPSESR